MDFFLRHLRANRSGVLVMLIAQAGLFLFGIILVLFINTFVNDETDYAALGSMMALMGTVFGGLLRGVSAPVRYRMAVSMGRTRLSYLLADPVITAVNCLVGIGFAWLLNWAELGLYGLLYPGWERDFDLSGFFAMGWSVPVLVAAVCFLDFCLGALQLRFGNRGFIAVWFPLCFGPMIFNRAAEAVRSGSDSIFGLLGRFVLFVVGLLPPTAWAAAGFLLALALTALSAHCYRRAEVRM